MKDLILLRGVPGAGKTTVAKLISRNIHDFACIAADDFMVDKDLNYEYDPKRLAECHKECQEYVKDAFSHPFNLKTVVVHNTFCAEWEMDAYYKIAEEVGDCRVHSIIVENRHDSTSTHDVPDDTIKMMKTKLMDNIKL